MCVLASPVQMIEVADDQSDPINLVGIMRYY